MLLSLLLFACAPLDADTPEDVPHTISEDGYKHARGMDKPFLCLNADGGRGACPDVWPSDPLRLSCDAAGCHGDHEYDPSLPRGRHLEGSDGPSCWTCHDREWNERKE